MTIYLPKSPAPSLFGAMADSSALVHSCQNEVTMPSVPPNACRNQSALAHVASPQSDRSCDDLQWLRLNARDGLADQALLAAGKSLLSKADRAMCQLARVQPHDSGLQHFP